MAASFEEYVVKIEAPDETVDRERLDFCQTCLTTCRIAVLKDMTRLYSHNGSYEKYSEMLYRCFSLQIAGYPEKTTENIYMICETCIEKLRVAIKFRNRIEEAQQTIKQTLENIPNISETITDDHLYSTDANNKNSSSSEDNYKQETENTSEIKSDDKMAITSNPEILLQLDASEINKKVEQNTDKNPYNVNISDLLKCYLCSKSLRSYNSKRNHLINVHGVKYPRIKCKQCNLTFARPYKVSEHVRKVHLNQRTRVCTICNDSFFAARDLTRHMLKHTKDKISPYQVCEEKFPTTQEHSMHIETQTDVKMENATKEGLPVDNKGDDTSSDDYFLDKLPSISDSTKNNTRESRQPKKTPTEPGKKRKKPRNHIYKLAPNQLQCTICDVVFETHWHLLLHMPTHFPNFTCEVCGKVFALASQFQSHKESHSNKFYECPLCPGKRYRNRSNLNYHKKNKHGSEAARVNKCHLCGERFKNYQHKLKHLIDKHGQKPVVYKCHICTKTYKRRAVLSQHIRNVHLGERNHVCEICNRGFFTGLYLREHMLGHTGVRNFPCQVCKKKFQRKYTLKEHMKIHTGEKKYVCDICKKAFTQKCTLKGHLAAGNCQDSKKESR